MAKQMQNRNRSEHRAWALVFLITFSILSLVAVWLIYQQFAQVFTRQGQCTVLSVQTRKDSIDTNNTASGAQQYAITFTVLLHTAEGQQMHVPGYYTSANYQASDQKTIDAVAHNYPVNSTATCGYTYLDPSGIKAIFQPAIPLEGFFFPAFFLLVSLIIAAICVVMLRRGPAPEPPLPDEDEEAVAVESGKAQQV